jgi:mRNA-degrading endonuclease RelE of RelBE toxin-antitoxin system
MRYVLEFTTSAIREFRDLDKQLQRRITEKVTALCEDPFPPGSKKSRHKLTTFGFESATIA